MPIYVVTFVRDDKNCRDKYSYMGYSDGQFRDVATMADNEDEALKIAEKVLAKQYPEDEEWVNEESGESGITPGVVINDKHRPDLAQSNYKLQGIVQVGG